MAIATGAALMAPAASRSISGVLNTAVTAIAMRPEILMMLLGSVPIIAIMPYVAMLIQWNLEHLEFYYEGSWVNEKYWVDESYSVIETRIVGDKIVETPTTRTRKVEKTRQVWSPNGKTSIRRLEKPQHFDGHAIAPPIMSNMMENIETVEKTFETANVTAMAGLQGTTDFMTMIGNFLEGIGLSKEG